MSEIFEQYVNKGWTTDSAPAVQPQNTVRKLLNMRVVSDQNNTAAAEELKGTVEAFDLNPNYFPIGWDKFSSTVVVLSTKDLNGTDTNGEIGMVTITPGTFTGTYIPLYNHPGLTFNSAHQIEARVYEETESVCRIYWTDFYNPFRRLNIRDSRLTTYIASGSLVVGQQYMVVQGRVQHAAVNYGPNEATTVFTASGVNYTVLTGPALVIEYINVSLLDVVPSRDQGNIDFSTWLTGGVLTGGGYQYAYMLETQDGLQSNFSYLSMAFHIGNNIVPNSSTVDYQRYQGIGTADNSQKGIRIQIDNIDTNFEKIKVVAVKTTALATVDPPVVIYNGLITGATMTFDHMGNEALGSIAIADLVSPVLAIRRIRTFDMLKKKNFIGDVELAPNVEFDNTGVTAETIPYLYQGDTTGRPDTGSDASTAGIFATAYAAAAGVSQIVTDQWYKVAGTGTITYNATVYAVGDTFQGVVNIHTFVVSSGVPIVNAILHIQKYTGEYRDILINDDWLDTKSAAVATHIRSNPRGETVRYGLLIYDIFQNPQYVYWLMDWEFPKQYDTLDPNTGGALGFNPRLIEDYTDDYGVGVHGNSLRALGVRFSGIDFNLIATALTDILGTTVNVADLDQYIGGFSIVRAPMDRQILAQGVLAPTVIDGNNTRCLSTTILANDNFGALNGRRTATYLFYSPEFLFNLDGLPNVLDGDYLEVQDYYEDSHKATADGTAHTNNFHYYEKFFAQLAPPAGMPAKGSENLVDQNSSVLIPIGGSAIPYGQSPLVFENRSSVAGFVFGAVRECTGSYSYLMYTEETEGGGGTYPAGFAAVADERSIVNFVRPKGNLYGGTSPAALAATTYIYAGHYQAMDAGFMAHLAGNAGVADDIEVFGGDTFVTLFDIARTMKDENSAALQATFSMIFPVETRINLSLRQGRHFAKDRHYDSTQPLINPDGICYANPSQPEQFVYNNAYSYSDSSVPYTAVPVNYQSSSRYKRRVYASLTKVDGELVDNFSRFPVNDYLDLDGRNGGIYNLRAKSGKLFCWQEGAMVYLPVEERQLAMGVLTQPLMLGIGGVLERADDLQNFYGNQHQFGLAEFEDGFVWMDMLRKEMVLANVSGSTVSLSLVKGLRTQLQNIFGAVLTGDNPVRNRGIAACYNPAIKEVLMAFRGMLNPGEVFSGNALAPRGYTVGFDNINKQYTGQFDMLPGIMLEFNNMVLASYTGGYDTVTAFQPYAVGDRVTDTNSIYTCILAFTAPGVAVPAGSDPTHWKLVIEINSVHFLDRGDVGKFFGYVYDSEMTLIVNPAPGEDKVFDNHQMHASSVFFNTMTYSNDYQSVVETVDTVSYGYRNRSWWWSIPFASSFGRFRDHYLSLNMKKTNRNGSDPTSSVNTRLKILSLKTWFRKTI